MNFIASWLAGGDVVQGRERQMVSVDWLLPRRLLPAHFLVLGFLALLPGCGSIGPGVVPRDRTDYLGAVADSWKQQTLLNVVRLRYGDAPAFLDIASVVAAYTLQSQVGAGGFVSSNSVGSTPWSSATVNAGVTYVDRPTISYAPLAGDRLTRSLLRPIPPIGIFQLIQAGFPADFILQAAVRSMNGVLNHGYSGGQSYGPDPEFYPLLDAMRRLQLSGSVSLRLEKRGGADVGVLVLGRERLHIIDRDLNFILDTLRLRPSRSGDIFISAATVPMNDQELAIQTRSMAEILIELGAGIEVPEEHITTQRTPPSLRRPDAEDPRNRPLARILSGSAPPADAFVAVSYRGTWYWIDDHDFASKRIFTLLMTFFSLAETGVVPQMPALTIPVN